MKSVSISLSLIFFITTFVNGEIFSSTEQLVDLYDNHEKLITNLEEFIENLNKDVANLKL